jgi:hypothetical protein
MDRAALQVCGPLDLPGERMNIDWSKAPAHATHWCPGNARIEAGWIYHNGGGEFYSCYADKGLEHIPFFPAWRALRLIPRPAESPKWTGEGLPPVGTVCEYLGAHQYNEWSEVKIFAAWRNLVFVDFTDGWRQEDNPQRFRPIRTPEQIEADEREMGINAIHSMLDNCIRDLRGDAEALWDAGYRKQAPQ